MGTLKYKHEELVAEQLRAARGKTIPKDVVLKILHDKLIEIDAKNCFIVDRLDGIALKELINDINKL